MNARIVVDSQFLPRTIKTFLRVRVHVCLNNPILLYRMVFNNGEEAAAQDRRLGWGALERRGCLKIKHEFSLDMVLRLYSNRPPKQSRLPLIEILSRPELEAAELDGLRLPTGLHMFSWRLVCAFYAFFPCITNLKSTASPPR